MRHQLVFGPPAGAYDCKRVLQPIDGVVVGGGVVVEDIVVVEDAVVLGR